MAKPVIGLTGGIASGKSTVARLFAARGVPVIDADQLAREVVLPGTPGLALIVETFGRDVLASDGSLDRKKLGDVVFQDESARGKLNAILHPLIGLAGARRIGELGSTDAPYILYEAALLVETGSYKGFSALVVVTASPEVQLRRTMLRDGLDEAQARDRIASQYPLERKIAVADYVIENDGVLEVLESEVERVHRALIERFARGSR